ncbi:MAG: DEAD/DEAH box helicase [Candidatus Sumerlaeota bacterium]|nr:DEAD/DEAH box helicase [Candidatus Sumerlaeota bacterium]
MTLPFATLKAHGFSDRLIERWIAAYGPAMLPLQAQAVQATGFLRGHNLIIFAPTSSGKTLVAEMAALKHLENRRRVIYLVPTKALAEEKFREFSERYGDLGFDVRVATRERRETDRRVVEGRFDLLIAIYEKMKSYLVVHPELLSQVGLVVMDEVQMLGEPGRGEVVDVILTKMARSPFGTQFIGLSAVLGDAPKIANWLRSELLVFRERPIELREGVFSCEDRLFRYRCFNSGREDEEPLYPKDATLGSADDNYGRDVVISLALELAREHGEQVLIFVPTRALTRAWAHEAALRSGLPPAATALEELAAAEDSHSRELLDGCLRGAVAFHNADLPPELRRLIEEQFNQGAIRALFSTSTLAQGVNLTAHSVIQVPHMIATEQWTGGTHIVPLSLQRFKNQGGRAARYGKIYDLRLTNDDSGARDQGSGGGEQGSGVRGQGSGGGGRDAASGRLNTDGSAGSSKLEKKHDLLSPAGHWSLPFDSQYATEKSPIAYRQSSSANRQSAIRNPQSAIEEVFGRSILVARGKAESERLRAEYLREEFEALAPPLLTSELSAIVTDLAASRICQTRDELAAFLTFTYSGLTAWSPRLDEFAMRVDEALAEAIEDHFMERDARGRLTATGLGTVMAATGTRPQTAVRLAEWVRSVARRDFSPMEPLVIAAFTPDARDYPIWLTDTERRSSAFLMAVREAVAQPNEEINPVLKPLLERPGGFTPEDLVSLKMAVVMHEWIGPRETRELEEAFTMFSGSIAGLGAQFNWLIQTAAAMIPVYGLPESVGRRLTALADRLAAGVEESGLALARLRVENLSRGAIRALVAAGFDSMEALAQAQEETLIPIIPQRLAKAAISEARKRLQDRGQGAEGREQGSGGGEQGSGVGGQGSGSGGQEEEDRGQWPGVGDQESVGGEQGSQSGEQDEREEEDGGELRGSYPETRLVMDLRGAGLALFEGRQMNLPPLAYQLLATLARAGRRGVAKDDIMDQVWQGTIVQQQQITLHKKSIINGFSKIIGRKAAMGLIETRKGFGLALNLPAEDIHIIEKES